MITSNLTSKHLLTTLIIFLAAALPAAAQYSIYAFDGSVKVLRGKEAINAAKDMKLLMPDFVEIPAQGWVEILSKKGDQKNIYRQEGPGTYKVPQIINNAVAQSTDNSRNFNKTFSMGASRRNRDLDFSETGMVTRSKVTATPGESAIDMRQMAQALTEALQGVRQASMPTELSIKAEPISSGFSITNFGNDPIYANLFAVISSEPDSLSVAIAPMGQQEGNYSLLHGHTMIRTETDITSCVLIATAEPFSAEELCRIASEIMRDGAAATKVDDNLPVVILPLQ